MPGSPLTVTSCSDDCLCKTQFTQEVHTAVRPHRAVSHLTAVVLITSLASRRLSPLADQEAPAMSCLCHRLQSQCEQDDSQKLLKGKQSKRKLFPFLCVFTDKKVTARYGPFSEVSQPAMCLPCWGTKVTAGRIQEPDSHASEQELLNCVQHTFSLHGRKRARQRSYSVKSCSVCVTSLLLIPLVLFSELSTLCCIFISVDHADSTTCTFSSLLQLVSVKGQESKCSSTTRVAKVNWKGMGSVAKWQARVCGLW